MHGPQFEALAKRLEGTTIDFKRDQYDFSGPDDKQKREKRAKFVKDILAMWNTPRAEPSHIVIGVEAQPHGVDLLHRVNGHIDDAVLQTNFESWVDPVPACHYDPVPYQ